jgi:multidrug resistance efflux pump
MTNTATVIPAMAQIPFSPVASGWRPVKNSLRVSVIVGVIVIGGVLAVLAAWRLPPFSSSVQRTDDAYIRGLTTVISPQVSGYVTRVFVQDYDEVKVGQPLFQIDDRIYRQRVEQAKALMDAQQANLANITQSLASRKAALSSTVAGVANAHAQLSRAQADQRRADDLVNDGSISIREADQTRAALRQAEAALAQSTAGSSSASQDVRTVVVNEGGLRAGVEGAQAALHAAEIDLEHTLVVAPDSGRLGDVGVHVGQYVTNGTQLVFLVPPMRWVIANFKEEQTGRMQAGQRSWFTVDALEGALINGHVERISPAAGSEFSVIKSDNATGNFVKVSQRIAVRIAVDPNQTLTARLRPGMSVEAHVDTTGGPKP